MPRMRNVCDAPFFSTRTARRLPSGASVAAGGRLEDGPEGRRVDVADHDQLGRAGSPVIRVESDEIVPGGPRHRLLGAPGPVAVRMVSPVELSEGLRGDGPGLVTLLQEPHAPLVLDAEEVGVGEGGVHRDVGEELE
jgi:hypothetical protein